uniref:Uncharacterized protein n=1 Tax=Vespula pensylvanica TaxID=30213 RepID=A0A834U9L7_VESPE|nr:hypothetical protein H0235_008992 [Vespula pensylvanica]
MEEPWLKSRWFVQGQGLVRRPSRARRNQRKDREGFASRLQSPTNKTLPLSFQTLHQELHRKLPIHQQSPTNTIIVDDAS